MQQAMPMAAKLEQHSLSTVGAARTTLLSINFQDAKMISASGGPLRGKIVDFNLYLNNVLLIHIV
jgi:hypothetical protein